MNWIKKILIDQFLGSYVKDFFKRFNGYKTFIATVFFIIKGGLAYAGIDSSAIDSTVLENISLEDSLIPQENIDNLIMGAVLVWGVISKLTKAVKKEPQVPNVLVPKQPKVLNNV